MIISVAIRELVVDYEALVRLEGRESAEAFVALECAAVIPSGTVHQHLTFKVGFRTVASCLPL